MGDVALWKYTRAHAIYSKLEMSEKRYCVAGLGSKQSLQKWWLPSAESRSRWHFIEARDLKKKIISLVYEPSRTSGKSKVYLRHLVCPIQEYLLLRTKTNQQKLGIFITFSTGLLIVLNFNVNCTTDYFIHDRHFWSCMYAHADIVLVSCVCYRTTISCYVMLRRLFWSFLTENFEKKVAEMERFASVCKATLSAEASKRRQASSRAKIR